MLVESESICLSILISPYSSFCSIHTGMHITFQDILLCGSHDIMLKITREIIFYGSAEDEEIFLSPSRFFRLL